MPRLRCYVQFPQTVNGKFRVESPAGTKVLEEPFEATTIVRELTLTKYSAYILVDGGLELGSSAGRRLSQSVYVATTTGVLSSPRIRESAAVSTAPGTAVEYRNKIRTRVSVSVS